jgi:AraC family L-rhamnose operon regulatory protein RhaS
MPPRRSKSTLSSFQRKNPPFQRDPCIAQQEAIKAGKISFHGLTHGHYPGICLPQNALPGLRSIGFWDAVGMQDWGMDPHRNEGLEISLLETGSMDFTVEKRIFQLVPGTLTVTRPWQQHQHGVPHVGPGRYNWLILDVRGLAPKETWQWPYWTDLFPSDLQELSRGLRNDQDCVWKATSDIVHAFRRLADYLARPDSCAHLSAIRLNINRILLGLLEAIRSGETSPHQENVSCLHAADEFFRRFNCDRALLSEQWTLELMAKRCGIGITALTAHCHAVMNTTPMDYLNLCRLSWAAEQLKQFPHLSITQIALDAGFSSSAYFATRFRERYGKSPHVYRHLNMQTLSST